MLQDFFFDLAQFRLGDNSAFLHREKDRRAEERPTRKEVRFGKALDSNDLVSLRVAEPAQESFADLPTSQSAAASIRHRRSSSI